MRSAILGARDVCDLPIIAQMTLEEDGNSLEGVSPEEFAAVLDSCGPDVIGVNCSVGPHAMLTAIEKMATATARKLSAMPNAGRPRDVDGRNIYLCSPEYMATYARRFIEAGARIVGGCCGTTPEHIRAIRRVVRSTAPSSGKRPIVFVPADRPLDARPIARGEKSTFARKIVEGRFVFSVEVVPPRGCDARTAIEAARRLHAKGIDAINVPDGPRSSSRMAPLALSHILQTDVGIETIMHYACRDRNLLGMQSDLLGAYAMGIRNLILVTGDPVRIGDYPDASAVFDVDSIGLTNMVSRLNRGLDMGGNPIGSPTGFHVGVAVNPGAPDLDRELRRFAWKVDAGAEFAVTQPVFDLAQLERFLDRIAQVRIPIIASIWPLASHENAEFLNNEVPGVTVPPPIMERIGACATQEAAAAEGIAIAREILAKVRQRLEGAQIAAPFGRYEAPLEVIEGFVEIGRKP